MGEEQAVWWMGKKTKGKETDGHERDLSGGWLDLNTLSRTEISSLKRELPGFQSSALSEP